MTSDPRYVSALGALAALLLVTTVHADGTEKLDVPDGVRLEKGSAIVMAGVGMRSRSEGTITLSVPAQVKIKQVLAYWEGQARTATEQGAADTILLGGKQVTGKRIGGPTNFFRGAWTSSYRADVTRLGLVKSGANAIKVSGLDFGVANDGAGLAVIVDDEKNEALIDIRDGNDCAFQNFAAPLDTTTPVVFTVPRSDTDRLATFGYFVGSVASQRPSIIEVTSGDVTKTFVDVLGNLDGPEWETLELDVTIPAKATSVSIRILSKDGGTGRWKGYLPASLTWVLCSLTYPLARAGGFTPGFWKNHQSRWDGKGVDDLTDTVKVSTRFNTIMGVTRSFSGLTDGVTLLTAASTGGGGLTALNRHAAAALANADSPINYPFSLAEVVRIYQDAVGKIRGPETIESAHRKFEAANEQRGASRRLGVSCGSGSRAPNLFATAARVGQPQTLWGHDAQPGAVGVLLLGVPKDAPDRFAGCESWVDSRFPFLVISAWVTPLNWSFDWTIPNDTRLYTLEVAHQAWFFPTNATRGFDVTNAVFSVLGR